MTNTEREALRTTWQRAKDRELLAPEWQEFEAYSEALLAAGWAIGDPIYRKYPWQPLGPDNFYLDKFAGGPQAARAARLAETKGGSANSPCIGCPDDKDGFCSKFHNCGRYRLWISACWRDFKIMAGA